MRLRIARMTFHDFRAIFLLAVACLAVACLAVGCTGQRASQEDAGRILHKGNGTEPATLDPHTMTGVPEFNIAWALFEGLVRLDPRELTPVPAAAESWEVSEDGLHYRFQLRADAKWSSGDPVTAQDFVYGWRRVLSPGLGCAYSEFLDCIEGAEAFRKGELKDFSKVGVEAVSERVLEVRLRRPTPHFLALQSLPCYFPTPP